MKHLTVNKLNNCDDKPIIIQNWADLDAVFPVPKSGNVLLQELELRDKFVVQCAGNMGLAQDIETMFKAIGLLKEHVNIHFLFIGSGAKRQWMGNEVRDKKLSNVTILDQRNRSDQQNFLNACDIAMVSLISGMTGAGVPSRMYNIMAVGKPIIAIAEYDSELAMVIEEEKIGWTVLPDNYMHLSEVILEAYSNHSTLVEMSGRARIAALTKYSAKLLINKYYETIKDISVNI
jgi:colanic acid biosynthesis glycosyl transferase WcaI